MRGLASLTLALFVMGCGSFDDYAFLYEGPGDVAEIVAGEPWAGEEWVNVVLGEESRVVALAGLPATFFRGAPAVVLVEVVATAGLTAAPEDFRYDFTATDDYNLFIKRDEDLSLLPSWEDMQHGYLYRNPDGDLRVGWEEDFQPWGSAVSAYRLKYMNGGTIELLSSPASDA